MLEQIWNEPAAVTAGLLGAHAAGSIAHEIGHYVAARVAGVRPTVIGIFSRRIRPPGGSLCVTLPIGDVRIEVGLHPLSYYVAFDDQHHSWKRPPDMPGALALAAPRHVAFIAAAGPAAHLVFALAISTWLWVAGTMETATWAAGVVGAAASIGVAVANLVPVGCADGAHILDGIKGRVHLDRPRLRPWEEMLVVATALGAGAGSLIALGAALAHRVP